MEVREDGFKIYNNNVGGRKVGTFPFDINVFGESLGWSYGIESAKNFKVIRVGVSSGRESFFQMERGIRFMLAPRSAKAWHTSIPGKSHRIRILPGSPSFSGIFLRSIAEQFSFNELCTGTFRSLVLKDMEYSALGKSQKSGSGIGMGLTGGGM
ncbi:hypothetical protein Tco_0971920 [Tanacetum coccineum]